jgi:glycosyltransferase involved in cell wall biosynthesis
VRVVMLTDDGRAIDRRILLEAETVADLGHEVIVIARNDQGTGVLADRIGRAKVLWIDHDLSYLARSREQISLPVVQNAPNEPDAAMTNEAKPHATWTTDPPPNRMRKLRTIARARALALFLRLDGRRRHFDGVARGAVMGLEGSGLSTVARARLKLGAWRMGQMKRAMDVLLWPADTIINSARRRSSQKVQAMAVQASSAQPTLPTLNSFEMNIWERSIFHRAVYFDPDLIHVHDLPQLLPALLAGQELAVPVIYDAHEVYPEIATLTPDQQSSLRVKEHALVRYCAEKITVNAFCADFMQERYNCTPFDVILNATQPSIGHVRGQSDNRLRKRLGLGADIKLLMFQGWMADVGRGLLELVASMTQVRSDIHLVMMGYGDVEVFRQAAQNAGVADRVHILPPVPWDELVSWSAAADVGVIPYQPIDLNHRICSPNKLFEFISAGLPILGNDLPFLTRVIEGEGFGITRTMTTPDDMANAINEMFDPELGHIARAQANLYAKAHEWEWPVEGRKLSTIYRRVEERLRPDQSVES